MGIRKTIYVPSEGVWDEVQIKAKEKGLSVSQYLLGGHESGSSQLDRIEDCLVEIHKEVCRKGKAKKCVGPKVIKTVEDIPSKFRSYSKAEQLGRK